MVSPIGGWHGTTPTRIQTDADGNLSMNLLHIPNYIGTRRTLLTVAGTEYSELLPNKCKGFLVKLRELHELRMAISAGFTATVYLTIPSGGHYQVHGINITGLTLYLRCETASTNAEIVYWI